MATTTGSTIGSRSKLWILMITAFIDMVGLLMVIPLLPFYAKSLGAGGLVVGMLVSSFSVAQLISAPMWGRFSDAYGRRPALLVGLGASVIAYIIFAFALQLPHPLFFLFLSRIVQGAGGGTVERDPGVRRRRHARPRSARRRSAGSPRRRTPASRSDRCSDRCRITGARAARDCSRRRSACSTSASPGATSASRAT